MKTLSITLLISIFSLTLFNSNGQVDESQSGGWYMYFFNTSHEKSKIGFQGDVQYRNWNIAGDLEQLLLRGGVTFKPDKANIKVHAGIRKYYNWNLWRREFNNKRKQDLSRSIIPN